MDFRSFVLRGPLTSQFDPANVSLPSKFCFEIHKSVPRSVERDNGGVREILSCNLPPLIINNHIGNNNINCKYNFNNNSNNIRNNNNIDNINNFNNSNIIVNNISNINNNKLNHNNINNNNNNIKKIIMSCREVWFLCSMTSCRQNSDRSDRILFHIKRNDFLVRLDLSNFVMLQPFSNWILL
ncbi:hypothetical protein HELRODRAFT_164885 [Helobdella robusta]|uniref:Uncharacterized protein n=1 Tax=Helobdella robusta TaxID=6412 RepID=T1EVX1_HELRO|nr:hypothetical protein HELRODRAFT_164885 [Helobdella robusta]ESN92773.1 hypothetical protein HELRODRAFT_164885 [Helobdella robusta]